MLTAQELNSDENRENISQIIRKLMKQNGNISQIELCRATGIPTTTLNKLLTGQTSDPRMSTLSSLADFFQVEIDQLSGKKPLDRKTYSNYSIPIVDWNDVTHQMDILENLNPSNSEKWISMESSTSCEGFFALESVKSLEPIFPKGSILIFNSFQKPNDGDYVVAYYHKSKHALVRELSIDGPQKVLLSVKRSGPEEIIDKSISIIGVLKESRYTF